MLDNRKPVKPLPYLKNSIFLVLSHSEQARDTLHIFPSNSRKRSQWYTFYRHRRAERVVDWKMSSDRRTLVTQPARRLTLSKLPVVRTSSDVERPVVDWINVRPADRFIFCLPSDVLLEDTLEFRQQVFTSPASVCGLAPLPPFVSTLFCSGPSLTNNVSSGTLPHELEASARQEVV